VNATATQNTQAIADVNTTTNARIDDVNTTVGQNTQAISDVNATATQNTQAIADVNTTTNARIDDVNTTVGQNTQAISDVNATATQNTQNIYDVNNTLASHILNDLDMNSSNELITAVDFNGTDLAITEAGTVHSVNLEDLNTTQGRQNATNIAVNTQELQYIDVVDNSVAIGNGAAASGLNSVAIGDDAQATAEGTTALGNGAQATAVNATALGNNAQATAEGTTALGNGAQATATNATALGDGAVASHDNSVALGAGSVTNAPNTVSVGSEGNTRRITNVAAGINDTDAVNVSQLGAVDSKVDTNTRGIAVNSGRISANSGRISVVENKIKYINVNQSSTSIGRGATAAPSSAIAVGKYANVSKGAKGSVALGAHSQVNAGVENSVALGQYSVASEANTISVGNDDLKRRITNIDDGINPYDAVNVGQLNRGLGALGTRINATTAMASAMSAMVPNSRTREDSQVSLGLGNYKSETAVAVGVFHYIDDDVLINAGLSYSKEGGVSTRAGVTWGF